MFRLATRCLAQARGRLSLQQAMKEKDVLIVDVRTPEELAATPMAPGAVNIPTDTVEKRLDAFGDDKSRPVVLYCAKGIRSANVATFLKQHGYSNAFSITDAQSARNLIEQAKSK